MCVKPTANKSLRSAGRAALSELLIKGSVINFFFLLLSAAKHLSVGIALEPGSNPWTRSA